MEEDGKQVLTCFTGTKVLAHWYTSTNTDTRAAQAAQAAAKGTAGSHAQELAWAQAQAKKEIETTLTAAQAHLFFKR